MAFIFDFIYVLSSITSIVFYSYVIVILHRLLNEGVLPWQNR